VKHGVAVWANRLQVVNWIDDICRADFSQLHDVMNMDKTRANGPETGFEVESAHQAFRTVAPDGQGSGFRIAFKAVHQNLRNSAFDVLFLGINLLRKRQIISFDYDLETILPENAKTDRLQAAFEVMRTEWRPGELPGSETHGGFGWIALILV
jgi:hypothetical protein